MEDKNIEQEETKTTQEPIIENKPDETIVESKPSKVKKSKKITEIIDETDYENLSEDELYTKIQTQKLLNRKKRNKIATLIGVCFAFVLAVCLIVLAAVPVSLKPRCLESGFSSVAIYPGTTTKGLSFQEDTEGYNKFMKLYDKAFSQSYISAIFSGSLFSYEIEEKWEDVPTLTSLTSNNTYICYLRYSNEQTFTYQNGKTYVSNYYSDKWSTKELKFKEVYFEISQKDGLQETTVYVPITNYPIFADNGKTQTGVKVKNNLIKISIKANTNVLYDNWDELEKLM